MRLDNTQDQQGARKTNGQPPASVAHRTCSLHAEEGAGYTRFCVCVNTKIHKKVENIYDLHALDGLQTRPSTNRLQEQQQKSLHNVTLV